MKKGGTAERKPFRPFDLALAGRSGRKGFLFVLIKMRRKDVAWQI
jgi:hypothetical protein